MSNVQTIHSGQFYEAYHITGPYDGLVISSKRKRGGIQMRPDHPQYAEYMEAFRTSIDHDESEALCRALLR